MNFVLMVSCAYDIFDRFGAFLIPFRQGSKGSGSHLYQHSQTASLPRSNNGPTVRVVNLRAAERAPLTFVCVCVCVCVYDVWWTGTGLGTKWVKTHVHVLVLTLVYC